MLFCFIGIKKNSADLIKPWIFSLFSLFFLFVPLLKKSKQTKTTSMTYKEYDWICGSKIKPLIKLCVAPLYFSREDVAPVTKLELPHVIWRSGVSFEGFLPSNSTVKTIAQKTDYLMTQTFIMWSIWKPWASIKANAYLIFFFQPTLWSQVMQMMTLQYLGTWTAGKR